MERSGLLKSVARLLQLSSLSGMVLFGALCFVLGASLAPPTVAVALAQFVGAAERVSLAVLEQRTRQALTCPE